MKGVQWVVYNVNTLDNVKEYKQRGAALRFAAKKEYYALASVEWYVDNIVPKQEELVEVINLMSGKPVMIARRDQGTCNDPSQERYWSM